MTSDSTMWNTTRGDRHVAPEWMERNRWRWFWYCRIGTRCANVIPDSLDERLPVGAEVVIRYTCGGCGTRYERRAVVKKQPPAGIYELHDRTRA